MARGKLRFLSAGLNGHQASWEVRSRPRGPAICLSTSYLSLQLGGRRMEDHQVEFVEVKSGADPTDPNSPKHWRCVGRTVPSCGAESRDGRLLGGHPEAARPLFGGGNAGIGVGNGHGESST